MVLVLPRRSLNIDFVRDGQASGDNYTSELSKLDGLLNFSRASTATRFNSAGVLETVAAGQPRFDFDPVTLACRGLLIEEARTNMLLHSQDIMGASWGQNGSVAKAANMATAPDGTNTADRVTFSGAGELYQYVFGYTGTIGSIWIKGTVGQTINVNALTVVLTGSWQRCASPNNIDGSNNYLSINNGGGALTATVIYVWGAQAEIGAFATSYIPTTTAAATRAAETCTTTALAPWFNPTAWSMAVEVETSNGGTVYAEFRDNAGFADRYGFENTVFLRFLASASASIDYADNQAKVAARYEAGVLSAVAIGGSIGSAAMALPSVNELCFGHVGGIGQLNGHIRRFTYQPFAVSDPLLKQMTHPTP